MPHSITTTTTAMAHSVSISAAAAADGVTSDSLAAALFAMDDLPSPFAAPAAPAAQQNFIQEEPRERRFSWLASSARFHEEALELHITEPRSEPRLNEPLAEPQMTAVGGAEMAGEADAAEDSSVVGLPAGLTKRAGEAAAAAAAEAAAAATAMQGAQGAMQKGPASPGAPRGELLCMNAAASLPVPNEHTAPAARTPRFQVAAAAAAEARREQARKEKVAFEATQKALAAAAAAAAAAAEARREQAVLSSRVMATLQMGAGSEGERRQLLSLLRALKQVEEQQAQEAQQQKTRQNALKRQRRQRVMGGQELSGDLQEPQALQQEEQQQPEQQQPEQQEQEGRNEEQQPAQQHWFSDHSPFHAEARAEHEHHRGLASGGAVGDGLASFYAPKYGPDGALARGAGLLGCMDGRGGDWSGSGGSSGGGSGIDNGVSSNPDFLLPGVGINPPSAVTVSNDTHLNIMRMRGISGGGFGGAATNVCGAIAARRKRRSPEAPTGCATAVHQWHHGSMLGYASRSGVLEGLHCKAEAAADAVPVGAVPDGTGPAPGPFSWSPPHGSMTVMARQHIHLLYQRQRLQQGLQQQQQQQQGLQQHQQQLLQEQPLQQQQELQRCEQGSQHQPSPEANKPRSRGSAGSARTGSAGGAATTSSGHVVGEECMEGTEGMQCIEGKDGMRGMNGMGQWQSDERLAVAVLTQEPDWCPDGLDNPKGCECGTMQDDCGTDDEWMPRCQGVGTGSAPNQRIKRRSMAERRRRERISEGLQKLRVKVRGRGDTCAMLDRAVGYVDALERRVVELERVVMVAAGSGRNVFPGNAFAGGAFAGRSFARNISRNDVAVLTLVPTALTSPPIGLGSDGVASWPWE
ncbi:unnamed protein product [Closterium sp. NIES-65]|nr:unnamed protein product [Closterium sp. NIES-65]